jgi:hypothetical protein
MAKAFKKNSQFRTLPWKTILRRGVSSPNRQYKNGGGLLIRVLMALISATVNRLYSIRRGMARQPDTPLPAAEAKMRICDLEERIQTHDRLMSSLQTRIRGEVQAIADRFLRSEVAIAALNDSVDRLRDESAARRRAEADFAARLDGIEAELARGGSQSRTAQALPRDSLAGEIAALKGELTEAGILPAWISVAGEDRFNGIISRLTLECGGNPADRGVISITASSVYDDSHTPRNAADLTDDGKIFISKHEANQWIEWDFKTAQIEPTHYSIRTHASESGGSHLRHWVLEGRTEDERWTILDERRDDSQLNGRNRAASFEIATRMRVKILRLRQTGLNHHADNFFSFSAFEIFGRFFRLGPLDWGLNRFRSLKNEFGELKSDLIDTGIIGECFRFDSEDLFNGIINRLTLECGGNPADRGVISITASSVYDDSRIPRNAADLTDDMKIFNSKSEANQWIEWDFKTAQIEPTHYSIRTHAGESGSSHLRHWVLEGRTEDERWTILDERRDDSQLNGRSHAASFEISTRMRVKIRRLRQTGLNHRGGDFFGFLAFEIFGSLYRKSLRA